MSDERRKQSCCAIYCSLLMFGVVSACINGQLIGVAEAASNVKTVGENPELFLDDFIVAQKQNLVCRLEEPARHSANPMIVQDRPWEKRAFEIYGTAIYDAMTRKYRCWYLASEAGDAIPDVPEGPMTAEYYQCYAESEDGIRWTKPNVGPWPYGHYKKGEHNIVVPSAHGFCVLCEPDDPDPNRRYKGLGGNTLGFSPDGINWSIQPLDIVGKNDTSSCVVKWKGEYLAFVRNQGRWDNGVMREVGLCVSKDFVNWTPKKTVFRTDQADGYPWTQPYGLAVTPYGDVLVGIVWLIHLDKEPKNNGRGYLDMQLLVSRDGRQWSRVADRATFMAPMKGKWDGGGVWPGTTLFVKDDTVHIYYTGVRNRHGEPFSHPGIGLATLPADRFVGLQCENGKAEGVLETVSLKWDGNDLVINAECAPVDIVVEILDSDGKVMGGFSKDKCRLIRYDKLRYLVQWQGDGEPKSLKDAGDGGVLRFTIKHGSLYAFQILN